MYSVLYVDDEPGLLEIGRIFLEQSGELSVTTSASARESLASPVFSSFDAIVSDYQMPEMDGIQFLKAVREREMDIPFILFTGRGREAVVIEAINNGADFYLQKGGEPMSQFAELLHKVKMAIERRKTERALQRETSFNRAILDSVPGILYVYDSDGRLVRWNRNHETLTGYSAAELDGRYILDWFPDETEKKIISDSIEHTLREGHTTAEAHLATRSGELIYFLFTAQRLMIEGKTYFTGIGIDITDQRKAEVALHASEEKFRGISERSSDLIYIEDPDGAITYISPSVERILGYRPDEMIGRHGEDFVRDEDVLKIRQGREVKRQGGTLEHFEVQVRRKDGSAAILDLLAIPVTRDGMFMGLQMIGRDVTERLNVERALAESEEKFRGMAERSSDLILIVDKQMSVTYASPSSRSILGYEPEEMRGMSRGFAASAIFSPSRPEFDAPVPAAMKGALVEKTGMQIKKKNGETAWVDIHAVPVMHEGVFDGAQVTLRDITGRKKAEEALLESETKFATVFRDSPAALSLIDAQKGLFVDVNDTFVRGTGYSREEVIGNTLEALDFFIQSDTYSQIATLLMNQQRVNGMEMQFRTKTGEIRTCLYSGVVISMGRKPYVLSSVEDISRRKAMESALRENQHLLADAMDLANLVYWTYDLSTHEYTFDDRFFALYGTTAEREGGYRMKPERYIQEFIHPDDRAAVLAEYRKSATVMNKDYESTLEHRIVRRDGAVRYLAVRYHVVQDAGGNLIRFHGANQDITDRRNAEDALRHANRQLSLLTGITRHDILNKVSIILGFLKVAGNKCPDPALADYLKRIWAATAAIQAQVEFTRVYEDLGTRKPQWVGLDEILSRSQVPAGVTFTTRVRGIRIFSDPMFERVFFNLLDNAIRHGQRVTRITVSAVPRDRDLVIVWEDDGVGIPAEEKEQIFERGFGKNTGLGLFLAREILALTRITIMENGEPGKGARFEMVVPEGGFRCDGETSGA